VLPEADVVIGWAVNARNLASARRLRWVHATAAGVGLLMFPEMIASEVIITNSRGLHADAMAEHTVAVILSFVRQLHRARDAQRERRWAQDELWTVPPEFGTLSGTTMVLVGLGAVGGAIATRARALGVHVVAVRRHPRPDPAPADEQWGIDALLRLLPRADWLVLAAPLTADTRHLIGAQQLERLAPSAVIVNVGRGHLIDEPALVASLAAGRLAGAALDVVEHEPLPADSPLWSMPNVLLTPHVSGLAPDYWGRAMRMFEENLRRFMDGRPLLNVVDKQAGY
jgi:phosphoglycerate dehydrogenase-like enzyme